MTNQYPENSEKECCDACNYWDKEAKMHNCKDTLCDTPHETRPADLGIDKETVLIHCAECGLICEGVVAMTTHILKTHHQYDKEEAAIYAESWYETVLERAQEEHDMQMARRLP